MDSIKEAANTVAQSVKDTLGVGEHEKTTTTTTKTHETPSESTIQRDKDVTRTDLSHSGGLHSGSDISRSHDLGGKSTMDSAKEKATELGHSASETAQKIGHKASELGTQAKHGLQEAGQKVSDTVSK